MRLIFFVCAAFLLFTCEAQEEEGECQLEGVTKDHWIEYYENDPVRDDERVAFKRFKAENVLGVELDEGSEDHKYFTVSLTDDKTLLTIAPSKQFENFEKEINSQKDFQFRIRINFNCKSTIEQTLSFRQPIIDLNTYEPIFDKSSYNYSLPMPLPQNFEITLFGEEIIATDYDITNVEVSFTITPDDKFYVSSLGPIDETNKRHKASIKVKEVLRLDENVTYALTVTDTGNPTRNTTTKLNLMVDKQTELPPNPFFKKPYYSAEYKAEGDEHSIVLKESIELKRGCAGITLKLLDNTDHFDVSCEDDKITVKLLDNLDEPVLEDNVVVLVTIEAILEKAEDPAYTVLVVYLPKQECPETTTAPTTTACPTVTTVITTSCPEVVCPTTPITTTDVTTACPECPECPSTEDPGTTTVCPECPITCPTLPTITTDPTTNCPECPTTCPTLPAEVTTPRPVTTECPPPVVCPTTSATPDPTTKCPECPTTCPTIPAEVTTACPIPTECPVTCPTTSAIPDPTTKCPECPTTCPTIPAVTTPCPIPTECPVTCPTTSTIPDPTTKCPTTCPTEPPEATTSCPVTTECPLTCPPPIVCPTTSITPDPTTKCPECPTTCPTVPAEVTTPCPFTCPPPIVCPTTSTTTDLDPTKCPECPTTCPATTECPLTCPPPPVCPTSTTLKPPEEEQIKFTKDSYWFDTKTPYEGDLGFVTAEANFEETVQHTLDPELPFLKYDQDSGKLEKTTAVAIGTYETIAHAKGLISQKTVKVKVVVDVLDGIEVKNSIYTTHIEENKAHVIRVPCYDSQKCVYSIGDSFPKVDEDFFLYDPVSNELKIAPIDREMDEIVNMLVPQFVLDLKLIKVNNKRISNSTISNSNFNLRAENEKNREWIYIPDSVPHRSDELILTFIIDDVNDNPPVFDQGEKLVVGYPTKELVQQMAPPYLTQVHATDKDVGINASIRYHTESKSFIIHPKTGVVYPCDDAFDNDLKFNVTATDRDGEGLSTHLEIEVRPLIKDNLLVLKIEGTMIEDLEDIIKKLSEQTEMDLRYLTAAVLPSLEEEKKVFRSTRTTLLRYFQRLVNFDDKDYSTTLVLYGLDKNKPIKKKDLEKALDKTELAESFSSEDWKQCLIYDNDDDNESGEGENGGSKDCDDDDDVGLIVAVAVLASLLGIFITAAAVFYYFKIYRKGPSESYLTMNEEDGQDSDSISFEKNPRQNPLSKPEEIAQQKAVSFAFNPPSIEDFENHPSDEEISKRRPTGFVFNPPPTEDFGVHLRENSISKPEEIGKRRPTGFVFNPPPVEDYEEHPNDNSMSKSEEMAKRRPTGFIFNPPPIEEDDDIFGERNTPEYEVPSYTINKGYQNIYAEPSDTVGYNINKQKKGDSNEYAEIPKDLGSPIVEDQDRPKSVKFKETVEKINIIVDDQDKPDDDVLDERL